MAPAATTATTPDVLANSDPEQARLMEERLILVDRTDAVVGSVSKKDAHLISNDLPLHRAFSIFLFDSAGRMCLQQRAATKVTFPSYWTNTVCSHPLHTPAELGTDATPVDGAKRAAVRKLSHELGVTPGDVTTDDLHYMTRILYRPPCDDGVWGEHELDYVFFAQKDVAVDPQPNEVSAVRYVTLAELKQLFAQEETDPSLKHTPWAKHIVQSFTWDWWKVLLEKGMPAIDRLRDADNIHDMMN